jgi:REP element-mobilizing transposase RayT
LIFSTKERAHWWKKPVHNELCAYLGGILKEISCPSLAIGCVEDHVHILYIQSKNIALSKVVEQVKKSSSKWLKKYSHNFELFHWQDGYAAFSVSASKIDIVKSYILSQEEHHKKATFKDELKKFLNKYNIDYDEKYLW